MKLTRTMTETLARAALDGGELVRKRGGFWTTPSTPMTPRQYAKDYGVPTWHTTALTVQALDRRGLLERHRDGRDHYVRATLKVQLHVAELLASAYATPYQRKLDEGLRHLILAQGSRATAVLCGRAKVQHVVDASLWEPAPPAMPTCRVCAQLATIEEPEP